MESVLPPLNSIRTQGIHRRLPLRRTADDGTKITAQTEKASHLELTGCEAFLLGDIKKKIPIHMSVLWYHKYDIYML